MVIVLPYVAHPEAFRVPVEVPHPDCTLTNAATVPLVGILLPLSQDELAMRCNRPEKNGPTDDQASPMNSQSR